MKTPRIKVTVRLLTNAWDAVFSVTVALMKSDYDRDFQMGKAMKYIMKYCSIRNL